jgi:hypothetical protein
VTSTITTATDTALITAGVAVAVLAGMGVAVVRAATRTLHSWRHQWLSRHATRVVILPPPQVEPDGARVFWATLADLLAAAPRRRWLYGNAHIALEYTWSGRAMTIACWVPGPISAGLVASAARAAWPGTTTQVTDPIPPLPLPRTPQRSARGSADDGAVGGGPVGVGGALVPALPAWYPLRTDHDSDPLRPMLETAAGLGSGQHACVQVLARPARPGQVARIRRAVTALRTGRSPRGWADPVTWLGPVLDLLTPGPTRPAGAGGSRTGDPVGERDARAAVEAAVGPWWQVAVRYVVVHTNPRGSDPDVLRARLVVTADGIASAFGVHAARNRYRRLRLPDPARMVAGRRLDGGFLLPGPALCAIATLPTDLAVPGLDRARATPRPAPVRVPAGGRGVKPLGHAQVGGHAVGLSVADARHHLHLLGATGSGKSTLMTHLILDDIANRRGVVVIDPKGDLATDVLDRLPATAVDRLVLIDPDQPVGGGRLNPLAGADDDLVVDNIVSTFGKIFARHWGPRIDDVLRVACLTLLRHPDPSLVNVPPLLNSRQFRARFVAGLEDPEGLGGFWQWYDTSPPALRAQVIGPVLARLRAFLLRDFVRTTMGGARSSFDMRRVLDGGILIARLPKGQLGEETAKLMGSFVLGSVWHAATARAHQPEPQRRDAVCYLDEAHNVLNLAGSVADMLAEARGYRLSLVLAHQDLAQLPRETLQAISANARNKLFFACSPEDAKVLARHTIPELEEHDLANLDAYTAAARLLVTGRPTRAFTLITRPPTPNGGKLAEVRAALAAKAIERSPSTGSSHRDHSTGPADPPRSGRPSRTESSRTEGSSRSVDSSGSAETHQ